MTAEEHHPALAAMAQARQDVGKIFLIELGRRQTFPGAGVFEDEFPVKLNPGIPHALRRRVGIDKLELNIRLEFLIAPYQVLNNAPYFTALAGIGGDLGWLLEPSHHGDAGRGERMAAGLRPVELQMKLNFQHLSQPTREPKQHYKG